MKNFTEHKNENFRGKCFAFTMAEILISLTIIGVIAAIIIPSLHANIEKKACTAKHKAFYSRLSQAFAMIDKDLNKYGQYNAAYDGENSSLDVTVDTGAMAFVTEVLGQTIKMNNVCDNENFEKCGMSQKIKDFNGSKISIPTTLKELFSQFEKSYAGYSPVNTKAVAFETVNGESAVVYYNPKCKTNKSEKDIVAGDTIQDRMCINLIYDVNGKKGPNSMYKDVFTLTMLGPENPNVISPVVTYFAFYGSDLNICDSIENSKMPNLDEATAFVINNSVIRSNGSFFGEYGVRTSTTSYQYYSPGRIVSIKSSGLLKTGIDKNNLLSIVCIKKRFNIKDF